MGLGGLCSPTGGRKNECIAAIELGVADSCLAYFTLMRYGGFPPSPPGAALDFHKVAVSENAGSHAEELLAKLESAHHQALLAAENTLVLAGGSGEGHPVGAEDSQRGISTVVGGGVLSDVTEQTTFEMSANRPGSDYRDFELAVHDPRLCQKQCVEDIKCQAWTWSPSNVDRLCKGTTRGSEPAECFRQIMHGGVSWGGGTNWVWSNAIDLCEGTNDASRTISCFAEGIGQGKSWEDSISLCEAR